MVNHQTGEYIGQISYNFVADPFLLSFSIVSDAIVFVILPDEAKNVSEIILNPGPLKKLESRSIIDMLFLYNKDASVNRRRFERDVLQKMRKGESGAESFDRMTELGMTEKYRFVFQAVKIDALLPLDPSDFSRGVNSSESLLYSIGLAFRVDDITAPWNRIEHESNDELKRLQIIYLCVICIVSTIFIAFSFIVSR